MGKKNSKQAGDDELIPTAEYNDFEIIEPLGQGAFGKVKKVRHKESGKVYAMKQLSKEMLTRRGFLERAREEGILQRDVGGHPFVVQIHYVFETDKGLYIVLDFVGGGDLWQLIKKLGRFSEDRAKLYAAELLTCLEYMREREIIFRDLKLDNILLTDDGHICLTDFGLAKKMDDDATTGTLAGTPEYMAPEILTRNGKYTYSVDLWSYGVVIYAMLAGGFPIEFDEDGSVIRSNVTDDGVLWPEFVEISDEAKDLVGRLLVKEPSRRLTVDTVHQHPWFSNLDWERVMSQDYSTDFQPVDARKQLEVESDLRSSQRGEASTPRKKKKRKNKEKGKKKAKERSGGTSGDVSNRSGGGGGEEEAAEEAAEADADADADAVDVDAGANDAAAEVKKKKKNKKKAKDKMKEKAKKKKKKAKAKAPVSADVSLDLTSDDDSPPMMDPPTTPGGTAVASPLGASSSGSSYSWVSSSSSSDAAQVAATGTANATDPAGGDDAPQITAGGATSQATESPGGADAGDGGGGETAPTSVAAVDAGASSSSSSSLSFLDS